MRPRYQSLILRPESLQRFAFTMISNAFVTCGSKIMPLRRRLSLCTLHQFRHQFLSNARCPSSLNRSDTAFHPPFA